MSPLPIFVALDVDKPKEAEDIVHRLSGRVRGFKIGPRLFLRAGPEWARQLRLYGELFLDFKFHDIPSTTTAAVATAFELGAVFCTVHGTNHPGALRDLGRLQLQASRERFFCILGVTVLTSIGPEDRPALWVRDPIDSCVRRTVQDLRQFELGGLVCSPHEVKEVKRYWPGGFAMVPGVQQSPGLAADQVRTMTAREAWLAGADALVIGRSLLQSPDPRSLLDQMAADWPARREIGCAL